MSEPTRTSRAPAEKRLTYQQWKRRKMLRLARNWVLFLAGCAAVVALLTGGILWLLPKVHGLLAGPKVFAASVYDGTDYVFNAADARLTLVNANLPYTAEPAPLLDTADEATGQQLEAEAAMQYRSMAAAAQADGVSLILVAGYQDADTRQALKSEGFKWAPSQGAWQRQLNQNAIRAAARLDFLRPEDGKSPYQLQPFAKRAEKDVSR